MSRLEALRRRLAPALLLGGLGLALALFDRSYPRSIELVLRLDGDRSGVTRLTASLGHEGEDPETETTWSFVAGKAPSSVRTSVKVPRGGAEVRWRIERADASPVEGRRRLVIDDKAAVTVPLRIDDGG